MRIKTIAGALGIAAGVLTTSPARADRASELAAQTLYDKALELMKAGKAASACPLLAESQRLDPAAGTQYRLADCFEKTGRPEAAWPIYVEVAEASKKAGRKDREAQARERADAVWKQLPHLTISIPPELASADGLTVARDEIALPRSEWNQEIPVAAGNHTVEARATGKKSWRTTVKAGRVGATAEVRVPVLEPIVAAALPPPDLVRPAKAPAVEALPRTGPNKKIVIAGVAVSAVTAIAGIGFGIGLGAENAGEAKCSHACTHLKNLTFWSLVTAAATGGATLTYALVTSKSRPGDVSQARIWVGAGAVGASFVRSW